jgi:uncharacterized protein
MSIAERTSFIGRSAAHGWRNVFAVLTAGTLILTACGGSAPAKEPTTEPQPTQESKSTQVPSPQATATLIPTSEPSPAPLAKREQTVDAMWYSTDDNGDAIGGSSPTRVTIEPNPEGKFRLGIFENEVGGTGDMWSATAWTSTIVAALLTNTDISSSQVSWDVAGRIDGPSAGGLMTAAVIAALRGKKVREDATMTGTINPDGTIGPVGGIPHKIEGSAKKGKKLILVPAGQRYDFDRNQQTNVDLVELGRTLDVEVKEVSDIYQAYNLLTGDDLPRLAKTNARPDVAPQIFNRLQAKTKEWQVRYSDVVGRAESADENVRELMNSTGFLEIAEARLNKSNDYLSQGLPSAAYSTAREAWLYASAYEKVSRLIKIYLEEGFEKTAAVLQSEAVGGKVTAVAELLKTEKPKTLSDANALLIGYSNLSRGLASWLAGQNLLSRTVAAMKEGEGPKTKEEELVVLLYTAVYYEAADMFVETAKDAVAVGNGQPGSPLPAKLDIENTSDFFRRAAEANFALFESTVLKPAAESRGMSTDAIKSTFKSRDIDYGIGLGALEAIGLLESYFKDKEAYEYAKLGAAMQAYAVSNQMVAKYYSLGAKLNDKLEIEGYSNDKALLNMLDLADEQARYSMNALAENGEDVSMYAIYYETGRLGRDGDATDKMNALADYWFAYIQSRAVAYLARVGVNR